MSEHVSVSEVEDAIRTKPGFYIRVLNLIKLGNRLNFLRKLASDMDFEPWIKVQTRRMRLAEFFKDYDRLRSGCITKV